MQLKLSDRIMKPDFQGEFTASILAAAASPDIISFAGGLPNPVSFPIPEMEAATKKVLEQSGVTARSGTERRHCSAVQLHPGLACAASVDCQAL